MAKANSTYQNSKVQLPQGADRLSIDSDGYFDFFGYTITGQNLFNLLYNKLQSKVIINSAGVASTINLPADYGYIIFSMADAASNASAWLCSGAKLGQELILMTRGGGSAFSVMISTSGVTLVGIQSGAISSIRLRSSSNSHAMVYLACLTDGQWSVIDFTGVGAVLQASA